MRNRQSAFRIFFHMTDGFIDILVEHELLFGRDGKKREHLAARERRHKCFLWIDKLWITKISGRGGRLHLVTALKLPGVIARIFLILERRIAAFPAESSSGVGVVLR